MKNLNTKYLAQKFEQKNKIIQIFLEVCYENDKIL